MSIRTLFATDISRQIEEVIKVDQNEPSIIRDEIDEYVATDAIQRAFIQILDRYQSTPNKPHEGIAIWISGFFGSGKSTFAKLLGLILENRDILGTPAGRRFVERVGNDRITALLNTIAAQIPSDAVIFDVSTDRGIRHGSQTLTEITYRLFLKQLGYAQDLDLADLEIALEGAGRLDAFKKAFVRLHRKEWDQAKILVAFAFNEASRVLHELDPATYPAADSWAKAARQRADITPGLLAERCLDLMRRRRPNHSLVFVVDEVGQFVARDVQKMLDLQAIVQNFGAKGRGKVWFVVTSQERLNELVGGIDDRRVELARLMDRFPLQVHLEPADISEVTSKRVLAKNAPGQTALRTLFEADRARLTSCTRLSADIRLPDLTADGFIQLYPLLPHHIDLIIQVVSGLRTQGSATAHVGGANRTIIKLAQQLLIHPQTHLADESIGTLVRFDQIYDLVSGNIESETRGKIAAIPGQTTHPLAQSVAKTICLLQFIQAVRRTAENIAALLHPSITADSRLAEVKAALEELEARHLVRKGDDGYRIPTPAEDNWEQLRNGVTAPPGDIKRILTQILAGDKEVIGLWQPQPTHKLENVKAFKAALWFNDREQVRGDLAIHVALADAGEDFEQTFEHLRTRSQQETKSIFWVGAIDDTIDHLIVEVYRSRQILLRRERDAQTRAEGMLITEEKRRLAELVKELRARVQQALLAGKLAFRGNERSPSPVALDVTAAANDLLETILPIVFDRFEEAAATVRAADLNALLTAETLRGLPAVFTQLALIHDQNGKTVFRTDSGPLREVLQRIENRFNAGDAANGRWLEDEFSREPFGWEFDTIRLLTVSLLRAGKLESTVQGQVIESATSVEARNAFPNNNHFRAATFRPKVGLEFARIAEAAQHYAETFGREIAELEQSAVAREIKAACATASDRIVDAQTILLQQQLPGATILSDALEQLRGIQRGTEEQAIHGFLASHHKIREAIARCAELTAALTDTNLATLARARRALAERWPFLDQESDLGDATRNAAAALTDLLAQESFFRELVPIATHATTIDTDFEQRLAASRSECMSTYRAAIDELRGTPGWADLSSDQQAAISRPLATCLEPSPSATIPTLRLDVEVCPSRLAKARAEVLRAIDGTRLVEVRISEFFSEGIESEEQLESAVTALRDHLGKLIAAGKKIVLR